jgi:putative lipoprotein
MLAQPGVMTLAECGPDSLYQGFANALQAAQNYKVRAGGGLLELVLPAGGGSLMLADASTYTPAPPVEPATPEPAQTPAATLIPIPPTNTPVPATATPEPTAAPAPVVEFSANPTTVDQGQCTTLSWNVANVQAVWVYVQGANYEDFPVTGQGLHVDCIDATTTYEMRVQHVDGSVETRQVTVTVNAAPADPLAGSNWSLSSFQPGTALLANTTITASFDGAGVLSGAGGCNSYSGGYTVEGASLQIGQIASTAMACEAAVMDQEQAYFAALAQAATFELGDGQLVIFDAGGQEILRFVAA